MELNFSHTSVLLSETISAVFPEKELLQALNEQELPLTICDCTLGGGGHALQFLTELQKLPSPYLPKQLIFVGIDQDVIALAAAKRKLQHVISSSLNWEIKYIHANFREIKEQVISIIPKFHAIYADLGVSSHQLDEASRGFSLRLDGPLDMRMNQGITLTAKDVLLSYTEKELADIFFKYAEEPKARRLASAIINARQKNELPTDSTLNFAKWVEANLGYKHSRTPPATRIFQGLRIEVNSELTALEELLEIIPDILQQNGKAGFISFHSLEDRIIKHTMRAWEKGLKKIEKEDKYSLPDPYFPSTIQSNSWGKETPRGGVTPSEDETKTNSRAHSARLRVFHFTQLKPINLRS